MDAQPFTEAQSPLLESRSSPQACTCLLSLTSNSLLLLKFCFSPCIHWSPLWHWPKLSTHSPKSPLTKQIQVITLIINNKDVSSACYISDTSESTYVYYLICSSQQSFEKYPEPLPIAEVRRIHREVTPHSAEKKNNIQLCWSVCYPGLQFPTGYPRPPRPVATPSALPPYLLLLSLTPISVH